MTHSQIPVFVLIALWVGGLSVARAEPTAPEVVAAARLETLWSEVEDEIQLRRHDKDALRLLNDYKRARRGTGPSRGNGGAVVFAYGAAPIRIICAPLRLCDIALEPGEEVTGVHLGDAVRWTVTPAASGTGPYQIIHALIKPHAVNLQTNLVIYTDRRVYHLELLARKKDHMPLVSFSYPAKSKAAWHAYLNDKRNKDAEVISALQTGAKVEELNFDYVIKGDRPRWRPTRVFDDKKKTYIEMPKVMQNHEAPILLLRHKKRDKLVNYRLKGRFFVVDRLFDRAVLVAGVGKHQDRVEIRRKGKDK